MNVLIVEDDELMADLLKTVVSGLHPTLRVALASTVQEAKALWHAKVPGLLVVDWSLPDGSGLNLIRDIRLTDKHLPIVMITGRADRDSILKAAHYGIRGYISKPFSVEQLHSRLFSILESLLPDGTNPETLAERLATSLESSIQVPTRMDVTEILTLMGTGNELSAAQLADRWKRDAPICARLLEVANRSSFRRSGEPVASVMAAISVMGVPMALSQALALALRVSTSFKPRSLRQKAEYYQAQADAVGLSAWRIATALGKSPLPFQTAGLLSRIGEFAVLQVMEEYSRQSDDLTDADIDQGLADWAQQYGNKLKVQWRLPLETRQMIGAVHALPRETVNQNLLMMRAAALMTEGEPDSPERAKLLRLLGLENWQPSNGEALTPKEI